MADLLVIAPHPDDAEIHAGGLIAAHVRSGARVVVVDATRGELASKGDPATRNAETAAASQILGLEGRENLELPDGAVQADDPEARLRVVAAIRRHRPAVVVCLSAHARHPDHIALAGLVRGAVKAAALHRLASDQPAWGQARLWFCEAELPLADPLLIPLTAADWERKLAAVRAYGSQFAAQGPITSISSPGFLDWIDARGRTWGHHAGSDYAEAVTSPEPIRLPDLRGH